jgi:hypothetical protein
MGEEGKKMSFEVKVMRWSRADMHIRERAAQADSRAYMPTGRNPVCQAMSGYKSRLAASRKMSVMPYVE